MFAPEARRLRIALERIVHRGLGSGHVFQRQADRADSVDQKRALRGLDETVQHYWLAPVRG
ncbi:MAG: hypothetical protein ABL966_11945, partial [Acidimicrobiales bacterium]